MKKKRNIMRHCLPDPKAESEMSGYYTVFSCEYDNGKRSKGTEQITRIGEDGKVMLLLCHSCLDQLRGQALRDVVVEAIKGNHPKLQPTLDELSASEALYGFMGWLTSREKSVTLGAQHEAGIAVELVTEFCKTNNLAAPRDGWTDRLTYPVDGAGEPINPCAEFHQGPFIRGDNGFRYCVACGTDLGPSHEGGAPSKPSDVGN
jgi:hypothetical protein